MRQSIDRFNYPKNSQNVVKEFLDLLRNGKFRIPICLKCDLKIWPPANVCSNCYSREIRMSKLESRGRLIEHSFSHIDNTKKLLKVLINQ